MKTFILAATLILSVSAAQASTVGCATNGNVEVQGGESIHITQQGAETVATTQIYGGRAMFITGPVSFPVQAQSLGPEVVEYKDAQGNWLLEVSFQPIDGHVYGTLTTEEDGQRFQKSVVCSVSE